MSKHPKQKNHISRTALSFLDFWCFISTEVGNHRLEINRDAKALNELFMAGSVHPDYLKNIVASSLENGKGKLNQPINLTLLLDSLGESAWRMRTQNCDDLFDIELLEEIAWHIATRFPHLIEMPIISDTTCEQPQHKVLSIQQYKILRKNRQG